MNALRQGQVILVSVTDPRGKNPKPRPAVILTATDELSTADEFVVSAISTQFDEPLPEEYVKLPWSRDGRAKTGLTQPSVVKCRWLRKIRGSDVLAKIGHVPPTVLLEVMRIVAGSIGGLGR